MTSWSDSYGSPNEKSLLRSPFFWLVSLAIFVLVIIYSVAFIKERGIQKKFDAVFTAEPIESFTSEIRLNSDGILFTETISVVSQGQRLKHGIGRFLRSNPKALVPVSYKPQMMALNGKLLPSPAPKNVGEGVVYFLGDEANTLPTGRNEIVFQYNATGLVETVNGRNNIKIDLLGPAITTTNSIQTILYPPPTIMRQELRATAAIVALEGEKEASRADGVSAEIIAPPDPSKGSDSQSGAVRVTTSRPLNPGEFVRIEVNWP